MDEYNTKRIFQLICEKMEQYNKGLYLDFFTKDSDDFFALLSIVYSLLLKEYIIDKNKKADIHSRLNLKTEQDLVDYLIDSNGLRYLCDTNNKDAKWLIDAIRDSILHNGASIDFNNKKVHIKNDMKSIECDIPFQYFIDMSEASIIENAKLNRNEISFDVLVYDKEVYWDLLPVEFAYAYETLENFLDFSKIIKHYKLTLKSKNNTPITLTSYDIDSIQHNLFSLNSWLGESQKYAKDNMKDIYLEFMNRDDKSIDMDEFLLQGYDNLFCKKMKDIFNKNMPEYECEMIKEEIDSKHLKSFYNSKIKGLDELNLYHSSTPHILFTRYLLQSFQQNNYSKFLEAFQHILVSFKYSIKELYNDDDELAKSIALSRMNSIFYDENQIHMMREKSNLTSNDTYYWYNLMPPNNLHFKSMQNDRTIYMSSEDYEIIKNKLQDKWLGKTPINMRDLFEIDPQIYEKYANIFKQRGFASDQDISYTTYNHNSIYHSMIIREDLNEHYYFIPLLFLYSLGTGIYSINKESLFEQNQQFIDALGRNIDCYSKEYYSENQSLITKLNKKLTKFSDLLEKQKASLERCNNEQGKASITANINEYNSIVQNIQLQMQEKKVNDPNIISYEGELYQKVELEDTAIILRNLRNIFSHLERVKVLGLNSNNIELVDYNDKNEPTTYIKTDIMTLFNTFKSFYSLKDEQLKK